jgi:hypothetical protein
MSAESFCSRASELTRSAIRIDPYPQGIALPYYWSQRRSQVLGFKGMAPLTHQRYIQETIERVAQGLSELITNSHLR